MQIFAYVKKMNYLCTLNSEQNNNNMQKSIFLISLLTVSVSLLAQKQSEAYLRYIDQWKETAILQQAEFGIPASITMAQALLESGAGQSELAVNAKNHFGIKCTSEWFGGVYYYDDDSKGECFRQYANAAESFKDHSLFLQRPRYATCFEIAVEDYEGWAFRLRECGYATDKHYASKLIRLIEDYHLDSLTLASAKVGDFDPNAAQEIKDKEPDAVVVTVPEKQQSQPQAQQKPKRPLKATVVQGTAPIMVIKNDPEPPYVTPKTAKEERDSFLLEHPKKKCNGVNYVTAREGDTYANVAFRLNVRERDLRVYNDALGRELAQGERIYLAPKKTSSSKEFVWTHTGQSLWKLSQEEGVQIEAILKLNELDHNIRTFRTRQKIYLKKVREQK